MDDYTVILILCIQSVVSWGVLSQIAFDSRGGNRLLHLCFQTMVQEVIKGVTSGYPQFIEKLALTC